MTIPYGRILYAIDLSDHDDHVLREAIALAAQNGAELLVLHVMQEMDAAVVNYVASVIGEDRFADLELDHEAELKVQLQERIARIAGDEASRKVSVEVCHGLPVGEILKTAESWNADLVVLGSHGRGRLQTLFLGSVAEQLLHRLTRPALVVPLPHQ